MSARVHNTSIRELQTTQKYVFSATYALFTNPATSLYLKPLALAIYYLFKSPSRIFVRGILVE